MLRSMGLQYICPSGIFPLGGGGGQESQVLRATDMTMVLPSDGGSRSSSFLQYGPSVPQFLVEQLLWQLLVL